MVILETQGLTHVFPDGTEAIKDINLTIQDGDFVIIAGACGSGKTVLVRHFNGLLFPTDGKVLLEGEPITKNISQARKKIGLIFQDSDSQIVGQTVAEDVAFGPENLGFAPDKVMKIVKETLEDVELTDFAHQRPQVLSGGQKRKLAVAGVLAMRPRIMVFDEPFTGLDYPGVVQVLGQILSLHGKGHTIVLVTHELEKALAHANRLIVMENGRIVRDGTPDEVIAQVERYGIKMPFGENRGVETMTWFS